LNIAECVCFHETDLPYGRGGSPIQNLIARGHTETKISALRMVNKLDAGPIYLKRNLSLEGIAEEIFIRASKMIAEIILEITKKEPSPKEQEGTPVLFKRRTPGQSEISTNLTTLEGLFNHIRMLDASGYPQAFIQYGCFIFEFSRPTLRTDGLKVDVHITKALKGQ
jgi:methionyl-tRNA formyltransferase